VDAARPLLGPDPFSVRRVRQSGVAFGVMR
jgi:hypothetical protein